MGQLLLLLVVALTVAAIVFGVTVLVTGNDPGLTPAEPDGRAVPLPGSRPLAEADVVEVRFDTTVRGYRMAQVDEALRRAAYDIGYKGELIGVLEAEVVALREGRAADADALRRAREAALVRVGVPAAGSDAESVGPGAGSGAGSAGSGADLTVTAIAAFVGADGAGAGADTIDAATSTTAAAPAAPVASAAPATNATASASASASGDGDGGSAGSVSASTAGPDAIGELTEPRGPVPPERA